ncbi:MAG TPA: phosphoribosylformylglycinamidine synthase subunit PurL [Candidatus Methanofastidiosa archaeon]|nr:phosphoribosylformylglycinamidine synthase subunit PurL [Candidatus Methanofastidiosa archaeon]
MSDIVEIDLNVPDEGLKSLSEETGTGLSVDELRVIRDYFSKEGRNPNDIELQALGQAWSEHCCYKSSKYYLKKYLFNFDAPQNLFVIKEDAGLVEFDKDHAYAVALESHNHPSAIEPYGGAATGIGGILRDVVCMGAQPIALMDPIFFAPPTTPSENIPKGVKHPKYIFSGVVDGIRDYGNRVGIPTVAGMTSFHEGYLGNCLVNVGCVGIVRKDDIIYSRVGGVGDIFVLAGGGTGRDGIHGVTFASKELDDESQTSSRSAVQVGDPIMKEPLIHACLEANEKKLLTGLKDLGGGGLSCVVGEMALAGGFGAIVDLENVHLKEQDMLPWEIWVSESQERMMMSVKDENLEDVLAIFRKWDVPAVVIGKVIGEKRLVINYHGKKIFDMDLEFLTEGPMYKRPIKKVPIKNKKVEFPMPSDIGATIISLLEDYNNACDDWVIRQYDFEVRARTHSPALVGRENFETHADASIIKPIEGSNKGLAMTTDVNPYMMKLDPFWGAAGAVDEAVRNLVAVGARPHCFADCLNFGNPEKPEKMWEFVQAVQGLAHVVGKIGATFVSGNVSFYNEGPAGACPPTPAIMGIGMVDDVDKAVTTPFKNSGNLIYLVGTTKDELGGSLYLRKMGIEGGVVPKVNPYQLSNATYGLVELMGKGVVKACHDISEGGMACAIAEMCIGNGIGAKIDLKEDMRPDIELFSESNTRWICEVERSDRAAFEDGLRSHLAKFMAIGYTEGNSLKITKEGKEIADLGIDKMIEAWQRPLWNIMG